MNDRVWRELRKLYRGKGDVDSIAKLQAAGAELNPVIGGGRLLTELAAGPADETAIVKALIDAGADLNAREPESGKTAIHLLARYACNEPQLKCFDMLLTAGADPNLRDAEGRTPLDSAILLKNRGSIRRLLKAGVVPDDAQQKALDALAATETRDARRLEEDQKYRAEMLRKRDERERGR